MQLQLKQHGVIPYYQKGKNPRLLIHTGTHGDEWRVIAPTTQFLTANAKYLPDFIFVPEVSPTAVARQTRKSAHGLDLNRGFFRESNDVEVRDNLELLHQFNFDLCVSIHEDTEYPEFYMYDSGSMDNQDWQRFIEKLALIGVDVLTGIDDPSDPMLGCEFVNGYFSFIHHQPDLKTGMLSDYVLAKKIVDRFFLPEVPTQSSAETKEKTIQLLFSDLIFRFL